jgi:hypothetical protein
MKLHPEMTCHVDSHNGICPSSIAMYYSQQMALFVQHQLVRYKIDSTRITAAAWGSLVHNREGWLAHPRYCRAELTFSLRGKAFPSCRQACIDMAPQACTDMGVLDPDLDPIFQRRLSQSRDNGSGDREDVLDTDERADASFRLSSSSAQEALNSQRARLAI